MSESSLVKEDVTLTDREGEEVRLSQIGMAAMHGYSDDIEKKSLSYQSLSHLY